MVGMVFGRKPAESLKQARAASREILDYVGLGDKENVIASSLTLSERKRLELARALAAKPRLILLDEMMAGLNPKEIESAIELVQGIKDSGITVIMVEHILKAIMGVSTRVIVLSSGVKIADGTPQEVVKNERVIQVYLGRNYGHAGN